MTYDPAWATIITEASNTYSIPEDILRALFKHESNWNTSAVGDGGLARGLGQMHPQAAQTVGFDWNQMADPKVGIPAAAAYLGLQFKHFRDWSWALGAYNQGPTVIGRAKAYADAVFALRGTLVLLLGLLLSNVAFADTTVTDKCLVKLQAILEYKDPAEIKVVRAMPLDTMLRTVVAHKNAKFSPTEGTLALCRKAVKAYGEEP